MKSPSIHFIIALVTSIVVSIGYGFWYAAVSQKSADVANLQSQIAAEGNSVSRIASARAAFAQIAGDEATLQSYFVAEADVVPFINNLQALGAKQRVTTEVLSVSKNGTPGQPALVLSLALKGTFDAVMRTVGAIEYAPYDLSITTLSVGQDAKNSWHADLTLSVGTLAQTATSTPIK